MANTISFEVMVLTRDRWVIHATYSAEEQAHAIRDAKALENLSTTSGVKVVREERDAKSGNVQENNIYASANLADEQPKAKKEVKKKKPTALTPPPAKKNKSKPAKDKTTMVPGKEIPQEIEAYNPEADGKKTLTLFGIFLRILVILLVSVLISTAVAASTYGLLNGSSLRPTTQSNIYIGLFIITFAVSFISMSSSLLSKAQFPKPQPPIPPTITPERKFKSKLIQNDLPDFGMEKKEKRPKKSPKKDTSDDNDDDDDDGEISSELALSIPSPDERQIIEQAEFIMKYLAQAMEQAGVDKEKLDNFNRFGINMFIAGACETLAQHKNLNTKAIAQVMREPIKFMGFKAKDAIEFSGKVQSYLLSDPKYMQMYQAGRSALDHSLKGNIDRPVTLKLALEDWNKPKEIKEDPNAPITVMFTDIAGSTSMTQSLGDAVAQTVVRTHNRIVRSALTRFNGKEIKHTGDGIMASFSITSNGIEATAQMQLDTIKHNLENPDLPLGLKIGLNTGEALAEDNDLFGTTVQLAARIVDKAQSGQIFVSETVHGICSGKTYTFVSRGSFDLKGFGGDPTLYELIWNKDAPAEPETTQETETPESSESSESIEATKDAAKIDADAKKEAVQVEIETAPKEQDAPEISEITPEKIPEETPEETPEEIQKKEPPAEAETHDTPSELPEKTPLPEPHPNTDAPEPSSDTLVAVEPEPEQTT